MFLSNFVKRIINDLMNGSPWFFDLYWHKIRGKDQGSVKRLPSKVRTDASKSTGASVLIFTQRYWRVHAGIDLLLARRLDEMGWKATVVGCGRAVSICDNDFIGGRAGSTHECAHCSHLLRQFGRRMGIHFLAVNDYLEEHGTKFGLRLCEKREDCEEIVEVSWQRLRRSARKATEEELQLREGLIKSVKTYDLFLHHYFETRCPDYVVMTNGRFFAEELLRRYCDLYKVPYICYEVDLQRNGLIFSRNGSVHPFQVHEGSHGTFTRKLSGEEAKRLDEFNAHRRIMSAKGQKSIVEFVPRERLLNTKIYALYTNVIWDSAVVDLDIHFANMFEWIEKTIEHFRGRKQETLIIRAHPMETKAPKHLRTIQTVGDSFRHIDEENIYIFDANCPIDSYSVFDHVSVGLVYGTTVGLEMAMSGIPVIVSSTVHYMDEPFVFKPESVEHYIRLLESEIKLTEEQKEMARRYAYEFFFNFNKPVRGIQLGAPGFEYTEERDNLLELFGFTGDQKVPSFGSPRVNIRA